MNEETKSAQTNEEPQVTETEKVLLTGLIKALGEYYEEADEIGKIIIQSAVVAAAAGAAGSVIPGLAIIGAITSSVGAIWSMYIRMCAKLGLKFGKDTLKALASAVVSNIVANIGGIIAVEIVSSFLPGISIAVGAVLDFCVVYLAGMMFLTLLLKMLKRYGSIENIPGKIDVNQAKKDIKWNKEDLKAGVHEATSAYQKEKE